MVTRMQDAGGPRDDDEPKVTRRRTYSDDDFDDKGYQPDADDDEADAGPMTDIAAPEFEVSRLHNGQLEFVTLVRVLLDQDLQGRLWPRLSETHFAADTTRAIYKRLQTLNQSGREWPKLAALSMDPALSPAAQAQLHTVVSRADMGKPLTHGSITLSDGHEVPLESPSDFEGHVFDLLDAYRITRLAAEQFVGAIAKLSDDEEFDPLTGPELVERAAAEVLSIRGQESISDVILHFGHGTTEEDEVKRARELRKLFAEDRPRFKTGIRGLDDKSGGFQPGEVVLLGSSTGGGKTAAQLTMMQNMARMGTSCAMLQLELSLEQMDERISAGLAKVNSDILRNGAISPKLQKKITQAWEDFHEDCLDARSRFTIYAPSAQTVSGCEMVFKQFPYKVWFVDYVNLIDLGGDDAKIDGWQKLSKITKAFKALAKKYNICIVLAVQVNIDNDGNIEIRYARAMKEDADIVIVWHMTQEARDEGVVWWKHLKARQYEAFDFPVKVDLQYYRFESFSDGDLPEKSKRTLGRKKIHKKDAIDEAVDTFKKKDKPLVVDDDRPLVDAAFAADIEALLPKKKLILADDDDDYADLDED